MSQIHREVRQPGLHIDALVIPKPHTLDGKSVSQRAQAWATPFVSWPEP